MNSCNRYICRIFCIAIAVLWLFTQPVLLIIAIRLLLNSDVQTSFSDELPVCQGLWYTPLWIEWYFCICRFDS